MDEQIVIKNGTIIDGTGKSPYEADVLIAGDKIQGIERNLDIDRSTNIIDAKGLVVAPGFIDVHSHLGFIQSSPRHPEILKGWIYQGVTTLISGNCGVSPAPMSQEMKEDINKYWNALLPRDGITYEWETMKEYFQHLEKIGQLYNVGILTGHNTLRTHVMGFEARFPTDEEMSRMQQLLRESVEAGSLGLSLGLAYVPGIFSNTDELIELASVLSSFSPCPPVVAHVRGMFTKFYHKAVEELITVAEKNGIPMQISHHAGGGLSRTRKLAIKAIEEATKRGVKIGHDNIPWPTRRTTALKIFPAWLFEGGFEKFFQNLQQPSIREQAVEEIKHFSSKWPPWEHRYWLEKDFNVAIILSGFKKDNNLQFNNMTMAQIAKEMNKDPIDALIDLVLDEHGEFFFFSGKSDDPLAEMYIATLLADPNCSVGTDVVGIDLEKTPVPGAYGGFTKILGSLVREKHIMSLEEAIRKMTSLPAEQMQLEKRGKIEKGYFADITIFNPKTIDCRATFKEPRQLSIGVDHVLINGIPILERNNFHSTLHPGKVLRRGINHNVMKMT